ncbi:MAG: DUF4340 domain-containing protein [Verrucomicrobiota bacterium]
MRTKVTLVLLLLNVALFSWIVHTRHRWQIEIETADRDRHPLRELAVNLQAFEFSSPKATIRVERLPDRSWNITRPSVWLANTTNVETFIRYLQEAESKATLDPTLTGQTLADYDLEKPIYTLVLTPAPASPKDPSPAPVTLHLSNVDKGGNAHLLAADGKHVHVVNGDWLKQLFDELDGLKEKRLFMIPVTEARGLSIQSLAAGDAARVNLREVGGRWLLDSPIATRASNRDTTVVLGGLTTLRLLGFPANPVPPEMLNELSIRIEGDKRSETMRLGKAVAGSDPKLKATPRYAKLDGRDTIFVLYFQDVLFELLTNAQERLRDRHVLDFDPADITAITLTASSQPVPLKLQRLDSTKNTATADWQIAPPGGSTLTADRTLVGNFLLRLSELRASRFENDAPSSSEVDKFGFTHPEREITLIATTGAAQTKLSLEIGVDNKGGAYARAGAGSPPYIYALASDALDAMPVSPLTYRDRLVRALPANARITSFSLTPLPGGSGTASYNQTLGDKETWAQTLATENSSVRREALQKLLVGDKNTPALLLQLRARSFVSGTYTDTVLVNGVLRAWAYRLTVTFVTPDATPGAPATLTLDLADRAGSDQLAGSPANEANVVFSLEAGFMDALDALITGERPAAPPLPVPAPVLRGARPSTSQ